MTCAGSVGNRYQDLQVKYLQVTVPDPELCPSLEEILQQFIPPTTAGELACITPPPEPEIPAIRVRDPILTDPNEFGLYHIFKTIPSLDPNLKLSLHNVADSKSLKLKLSFTSESVKPGHDPVCGLGVDTHNPSHSPFTNWKE